MPIPILMYHSIGEDCAPAYRRWMVTPKRFEAQLKTLMAHGYRFVTMSELIKIRSDTFRVSEPIAAITFDDGLADFASGAVPVLERLGIPATLFVATGYIGETARWLADLDEGNRPMLSKADLRALAGSGIECGGHTHTHPQLDLLDESAVAYEVTTSRNLLSDWLGQAPISFAYPHGYSTQRVRDIVARAGFLSACRVAHALSALDENPYALSRIIATEDVDEAHLERMLDGSDIRTAPPLDSVPIRVWRLFRWVQSGAWRPAALLFGAALMFAGHSTDGAAQSRSSLSQISPYSVFSTSPDTRPPVVETAGAALIELADLYRDGGIEHTDAAIARDYYRTLTHDADDRTIAVVLPPLHFAQAAPVELNPADAQGIYLDAAAAGETLALVRLGDLLSLDEVVERDYTRAFFYYARAALLGDTIGQLRMAEMQILGQGTTRNIEEGMATLEELMDAGESAAMVSLAQFKLDPTIAEPDPLGAIAAYMAAGETGRVDAWERLGMLYRYGGPIQPDPTAAYEAFSRAAALGSVTGSIAVAEALVLGQGITRDTAVGIQMLEELAATGDIDATLSLADLLDSGADGAMPRDPESAADHYRQAAAQGSSTANRRLGALMVAGALEGATREEGLALLQDAAQADPAQGYYEIGDLLIQGDEDERDLPGAISAFEQSAQAGNAYAMLRLGYLYRDPDAGTPDLEASLESFRSAAENGLSVANQEVGMMLAYGQGTPADVEGGLARIRAQAETGDIGAWMTLGDMLSDPELMPPDAPGVIEAFEQAAALGHIDALIRLGDIYRDGILVAADGAAAQSYYERAAEQLLDALDGAAEAMPE